MASKPMWLRVLGGEAAKVLRGSDTIGWLTTDGAKALETHAKKRQDEMARVRDALASNSARIPEFDRAVRFAEAEAAAQKRLACWLQGATPKKKGDV
jgi:hypothetical protein